MSQGLIDSLDVISSSLNYSQWIYSLMKPHLKGVVLDIGSGFGAIARQIETPLVTKLILTDRDEPMLKMLRQQAFHVPDHEVHSLDVTDRGSVMALSGLGIDAVTCVNVLEHIPDDLAALRNMHDILKPGGHAVIFVPALPGIFGSLDRTVAHVRRYKRSTMRPLMERAGFEIEQVKYMNFPGIITWYVAGKILRQTRFHVNACRRLDRIVPVLRAVESVVPVPVGQSLMMVGRKPSRG